MILVVVVIFSYVWGDWNTIKIGTLPTFLYQVAVGDGRNDGIDRVYVSTYDGYIYEGTYYGGWSWVEVGHSDSERMLDVTVGNGRGDGINRVYGGSQSTAYEFTYTPGGWNRMELGVSAFSREVWVCDGRDDDIMRVYAGSGGLKECTWNGSSWDALNIGESINWHFGIGAGRSDDTNRIYCPGAASSSIREYTWNSSSYDESIIGNLSFSPLLRMGGKKLIYPRMRHRLIGLVYVLVGQGVMAVFVCIV
ncbi:MAG: hypothetical protein QMD71_09675 [bacterium]|nr:hypothetical protein [bacterium]